MHEYWHVILHSLIDTIKFVPFLFIIYYLIELIEYKCSRKFKNNKFLKGKLSPIFGSLIGSIPQCGFSVVSTDLFSQGAISIGALIAVYIATSDEAIPLMFSNINSVKWAVLLIVVKILYAIVVGYLSLVLYKFMFKSKNNIELINNKKETHSHKHNHHNETEKEHKDEHVLEQNIEQNTQLEIHDGCCKHHVNSNSFEWYHPLLHCLKISLFILVINIIFGFVTEIWIGEENLIKFLNNSIYLQPLFAVLIGLIPNCASSVVLAEMFMLGGLSFGGLVAGLSVNAGLGIIILLKQNKNVKLNVFIITILIVSSLIIGYALNFITI